MKLYHFTAKKFEKSIDKNGLTIGGILCLENGDTIFKQTFIWLTKNPSNKQSWNVQKAIPYDRTEIKYEIDILCPSRNLYSFDKAKRIFNLHPDLSQFGDFENWYIYRGAIPRNWFIRKWVQGKEFKEAQE